MGFKKTGKAPILGDSFQYESGDPTPAQPPPPPAKAPSQDAPPPPPEDPSKPT